MPSECTKIAEDWHKHAPNLTAQWSKLSQATKPTKKQTVKTTFLTLVEPHLFTLHLHLSDLSLSQLLLCFMHITQKDYLPKSNGREKAAKRTNIAAKKEHNSSKAVNIALI